MDLETHRAKGRARLEAAAFGRVTAAEYADAGDTLLWSMTVWRARWAGLAVQLQQRIAETSLDEALASPLAKAEQEASDRATRAAEAALRNGLAERQVRLWERMAENLAGSFTRFAVSLGFAADDPRVIEGAVVQLEQLAGGEGSST